MKRSLIPCAALAIAVGSVQAEDGFSVLILAGQSNALNWHAAAAELPADAIDGTIPFFHTSGAPPDRGFAVPINASSQGTWGRLGPQRQEPYIRYEREFFGPEITLARAVARGGRHRVAVIKVAFFGTSLAEDWLPAATEGNRLYAELMNRIRGARSTLAEATGHSGRITGFFWLQGETDGARAEHARAYATNLADLFACVRRDLGDPDLPIIIGRVGPPPPQGYPFQDTVRRAQVDVAGRDPFAAWVDTDDLPRDTDHVHLLATGVMRLGERMAAAWSRLAAQASNRIAMAESPSPAKTPKLPTKCLWIENPDGRTKGRRVSFTLLIRGRAKVRIASRTRS